MAIGAILTLFCLFVFLTVMCTKTWRWFHVTMIFFVFIASNFLVTIAAVSLRTHSSWQRDHDKKSKTLQQLKSDYQAMSQGNRSEQVVKDPIDQRADDIPQNMFDVRSKLTRVMMDRGRVWRGASVQGVSKDADWQKVEIKLATVENPNQIQGAGTVLYAFKEALAPNEVAVPDEVDEMAMEDDPEAVPVAPPAPVKVPVVYMGEFRVVNAGAGDVTLGWTYAPSRVQRMHMSFADKTTWVLYEKMPVDGHQLFSFQMVNDVSLDDKDPGVPERNEERDIRPLFGKMDPAEIEQVFQMVTGETFSFNQAQATGMYQQLVGLSYPNFGGQWGAEKTGFGQTLLDHYPNKDAQSQSAILEAIMRNYKRDGYRAEENPPEPEEDVWVKVRFAKALKFKSGNRERSELQVDGAQPEAGVDPAWKGLDLPSFDTQGRALVGRLRRGEPVEFNEKQIAVLHKGDLGDALAHLDRYKQLETEGIVERLFDIYVRPLNDYEYRFHDAYQNEIYLLQRIQRSQREWILLDDALKKTQAEIAYRTDEKTKLGQDLGNHQKEEVFVKQYVAQLEAQKVKLRQDLARIFQTNQALAKQLTDINRRLTEEIDRRTNAVGRRP